jgi:AraC family cel operon transcriptional repressor
MQKLAGRTPGHLCKVFRKHLRKTPTDYINELRINHAASMLADTHDEIVAIADELNFQSLSRFYSLFRKTYGISPAAYRRLHLNNKHF